jgi:penicillin amidase
VLRLLGALFAAALLLILAAFAGWLYLRTSLPQVRGELRLAGPHHEIQIVRDRYAVPHIYAQSAHDAYFALGVVHAQDRLWQMELQRRIGAGRLSELFGPEALGTDRFMRTLSLYHYAERALEHLDIETRENIEAYVAGINAYLTTRSGPLPPEFLYFRHTPEPWQAADVLVWAKILAWDLSGNWGDEILRARLIARLSEEQLEQLWPPYPEDAPIKLPDFDLSALDWDALAAAFPSPSPPGLGSNAWVLAGERTQSGLPLLANDPHLGLMAPPHFYITHLVTPEFEVIGATLPGTPAVLLGHNTHIAWGFTNAGPDVQDLVVERLDPEDANRYETPEGFETFTTRRELIRVQGGDDVEITVRESRHGPIISDVSPAAAAAAAAVTGERYAVALRWTALVEDDLTVQAILKLPYARDWESFTAALRDFHVPQQNVFYADTQGNIGYYAPGRIPLRAAGDGRMPVPGWTDEYAWEGYIPFEELPHALNPAGGVLMSANHKIVPDAYPHFLSFDWAEPYRAERIEALLAELARHTLDSTARIQRDQLSLMAQEFLPILLEAAVQREQERAAHALLATWDGTMDKDRPEPLIFHAWYREFVRAIFADELGELFADYWGFRPLAVRGVLQEHPEWCNDVRTPAQESCAFQATAAFERAMGSLREAFGSNISRWRWGDAHQARFRHTPFTRTPLERLFDLAVPNGGDAFTVNAARFNIAREPPFEQTSGPALRAIYDLSDLSRSRFILPTGQSGNPLSPHYRDQLRRWQQGEYLPLILERSEAERGALGTLRLVPR